MKFLQWIYDNSLSLITLFLLIFIPLYPKKPLVDVVNTWVYVRLEDFIVVDTKDVLLICKKDKEQDIKDYVAEVKRNKGDKFL